MGHDIRIKTADGYETYNADSYRIGKEGFLTVRVGTDDIHFSPHYWQAYVVDPSDNGIFDDLID